MFLYYIVFLLINDIIFFPGVLLFAANYRAHLFRNFRRGINQQEENILLHML